LYTCDSWALAGADQAVQTRTTSFVATWRSREHAVRIGERERMSESARKKTMHRWVAGLMAVAVTMTLLLGATPARADDAQDARQIVEKAKLTVEEFQRDPNMGGFREHAKKAKGMLILPQMLRGAFIVGASGGTGVLVARDEKAGQWRGPAFHTLGGASFGFQAGADAAEVIILAMTERGVTKLLSPQAKLGADISVAAGPVGAGVAAGTAGLSADLISYSMAKGLYGGFSVDGSVAGVRTALNQAYYGKPVTPSDILMTGAVKNPQADPLIGAVTKLAGGR
jgi:SH3 domain-containing YSC84-like protein 1